MYAIYALIDPRNGAIRYIGQAKDLQRRLHDHRKWSVNKRVFDWRKELKDAGLEPSIQLLELVSQQDADAREEYYILWALRRGCDLLNMKRMAFYRSLL